MPLLRVSDLSLSFGPHVLLDQANVQVFKGDRICLVGRNGAGKSTFMKLIEGSIKPDGGSVWRRPALKIARLEQELPDLGDSTVMDVVASGLAEVGELLSQYHHLLTGDLDDEGMSKLSHLQHELEAKDGWSLQQRIDEVMSRLSLPAEKCMSELSGGWKRRVALARALVSAPDLLLLDEPTNHLDVETIEWLEQQVLEFNGAILFITHDRALAKRLATKIIELDRGRLRSYDLGYEHFLAERDHLLAVEDQQNALFDKRLAEEEVWIRQGIKARRTRNEGRVRALERMREQRSQRRNQQGNASIAVETASASGKIVAAVKNMSYGIEGNQLVSGLTFNLLRGDKIGLLGPNGSGKTTLLNLLLGTLQPSSGEVKLGTRLDIAYFDQMRSILDDEKTIIDTVGQGRESIEINGKSRHVISYLSDFLFSPQRARTPLKALSGGERNRVQLACLFSMPANLLVLDEPTNDLDVETLELLESVLVEFDGTVLLVSHDRDFMDNVVTSTLAFEGHGNVREYVGGYKDWLRQGGGFNKVAPVSKTAGGKRAPESGSAVVSESSTRKPGYKEKRELESLPPLIESLEQQQAALQKETEQADFYQQDHEQVNDKLQQLAAVSSELEQCYERWLELSES